MQAHITENGEGMNKAHTQAMQVKVSTVDHMVTDFKDNIWSMKWLEASNTVIFNLVILQKLIFIINYLIFN